MPSRADNCFHPSRSELEAQSPREYNIPVALCSSIPGRDPAVSKVVACWISDAGPDSVRPRAAGSGDCRSSCSRSDWQRPWHHNLRDSPRLPLRRRRKVLRTLKSTTASILKRVRLIQPFRWTGNFLSRSKITLPSDRSSAPHGSICLGFSTARPVSHSIAPRSYRRRTSSSIGSPGSIAAAW